jgi:hypothetical protein
MVRPRHATGAIDSGEAVTDIVTHAVHYAALGYAVLPLMPHGKRPATAHGLRDATTDPDIIGTWADHYNLGLLPPPGVLVLDADTPAEVDRLETDYPELATAPRCDTPRGGAHLYTRLPDGTPPPRAAVRAAGRDLDVRGLGRAYLVAPPSTVPQGAYNWTRDLVSPAELPETPAALLALLRPPPPTTSPRQVVTPRAGLGDRERRYALAALQREHDNVAAAPEGARNDTLNRAAYALGQLVGAGALERAEVEDALMAAAEACGLGAAEAERTIRSGLEAGMQVPREMPEPTGEVRTPPGGRQGAAQGEADEKTAGVYAEHHNTLHYRKTRMVKSGNEWTEEVEDVPLCNFTARITRQLTVDDGAETRRELTLEGRLETGQPLPTAAVSAAQFASFGWLTDQWGALAIINAGQANRDRLREAIQRFSAADGIDAVTTYAHLGWRLASEWTYLHAGGGVTAHGLVDGLSVTPGDALSAYRLELPGEGGELAALRASLAVLDVAPKPVTLPLWLSIYRAVITRTDYTLFLAGRTGAMKTTLAQLVLSHHGRAIASPDYEPASYEATANALEAMAFAAKDAALLIDDYAPQADRRSRDEYQRTAARILRVQGNRTGRGRLRPDGTARPLKPPRGLIITTGEDLPKGHSLRTRALVLELKKGDVDTARLSALQHRARAGLLAQALTLYIRWLAPRMGELPARLQAGREHYREHFPSAHGRTTDTCAELMATADLLALWLEGYELGLDRQMVYDTLLEVAHAQAGHQTDQDDTHRFLAYLNAALSSGRAHLANYDGAPPPDATRYGWQRVDGLGASYLQPRGPKIGWLAQDGALLLEPAAAYAAVQRFAADAEDTLGVTQRSLYKRLAESGITQSPEADRNTYKATVEGQRRHVIRIPGEVISSQNRDFRDRPQDQREGRKKRCPENFWCPEPKRDSAQNPPGTAFAVPKANGTANPNGTAKTASETAQTPPVPKVPIVEIQHPAESEPWEGMDL